MGRDARKALSQWFVRANFTHRKLHSWKQINYLVWLYNLYINILDAPFSHMRKVRERVLSAKYGIYFSAKQKLCSLLPIWRSHFKTFAKTLHPFVCTISMCAAALTRIPRAHEHVCVCSCARNTATSVCHFTYICDERDTRARLWPSSEERTRVEEESACWTNGKYMIPFVFYKMWQ